MNVKVIHKKFSKRDADISEMQSTDISEKPLSGYLSRMKVTVSKQIGHYRSIQGCTITPLPFWAINFDTVEKMISGRSVIQPRKDDGLHVAKTAKWAEEVEGTGQQKDKWRGSTMRGPVTSSSLFSVVSSSWLAPFSIIHRYVVFIPANLSDDRSARITLLKDVAREDRMESWLGAEDTENDEALTNWVRKAQQEWKKYKTSLSRELVTERLNYQNTLIHQPPRSVRLVHTRSRFLKAAVLNPKANTALGLPLNEAILKTRSGIEVVNTVKIPFAGTIVDNMLHWIEVDTQKEAYWLSGIFNSEPFRKIVMKKAGGERGSEYVPNIYSIPVKVLAEKGLVFDHSNCGHIEISDRAKYLEEKMTCTAKTYLTKEKHLALDRIDDSVDSPEIPASSARVYLDRLEVNYRKELEQLDDMVKALL